MVSLGFDLGKIKPCICGQMPRFEFFEGGPNKNNIIQIYCTRYLCNIPQFAIGPTIESTINMWNKIVDGYSNVKEEPEDSVKLKVCPVCGYSFAFGDVCHVKQNLYQMDTSLCDKMIQEPTKRDCKNCRYSVVPEDGTPCKDCNRLNNFKMFEPQRWGGDTI